MLIEKWNMRELQIIQSVFDQVLRKVQGDGENRVNRLHLVLGELSELNPISVQNQWRAISKAHSWNRHNYISVLYLLKCNVWPALINIIPPTKTLWPYCGRFGAKILTGEKCYLESIETKHE